jgi:hypothetical protein
MTKITEKDARKVLDTVDAGLVKGKGVPEPGQMCVEAAVCYALGLPHGDDPACVSRALRQLKITLNDSCWSSNQARAKGLRRLALIQLGSRNEIDDNEFARRVAEMTIRKVVPYALWCAAKIHKDPKRKQALLDAASRCENEGTGTNASYAAYTTAATAASAAAYAASYAASYASYATACDAAACDKVLSKFAEEVVQILIGLKAPGAKWLWMTEEAA